VLTQFCPSPSFSFQEQVKVSGLQLQVFTQGDALVQDGVSLRVGDKIYFEVKMIIDGNYRSSSVIRCTASTSPTIPDSMAETRPIISNGCTEPNIPPEWYMTRITSTNASIFTIRTGRIPLFKLPSSNVIFFHFTLQLCSVNEERCALMNKTSCDARNATGARRRRAVSDLDPKSDDNLDLSFLTDQSEDVIQGRAGRSRRDVSETQLSTRINVASNSDPEAMGYSSGALAVGSTGFIIVIAIAVIVAIVLAIAIVSMAVALTRKSNSGTEQIPHQPQLFALPRIQRTHSRF